MSKEAEEKKKKTENPFDVTNPKNKVLERVHRYALYGTAYEGNDYAWRGRIMVNRDVQISLTDRHTNKPFARQYKAGEEYNADIVVLRQLVLRATQEGVPDRRHNWYATGGVPNADAQGIEPLEIAVLKEWLSEEYAAAHEPMRRFPTPG